MKVTIAKTLAMGEQVVVEIQGSPKEIERELPSAYNVVDHRLWTMNQRVLALNERYQEIAKSNPEVAVMVNDIFLVVSGQKAMADTSSNPAMVNGA